MKIDRIYVNTYRYDFIHLRICIASIRYWYPDIPVSLIKDNASWKFNTDVLEKKWKLDVLRTSIKEYGWGFGKLETLFLSEAQHFLVLDSDTVLTGYILDEIMDINADFIVDDEVQPEKEIKRLYYDRDKVKMIFPSFVYPGYTFNSGQWFGSSKKISEDDFAPLVDWKPMPVLKYPESFMPGDQGILNLVIHLRESQVQIKVQRTKIMLWPKDKGADSVSLESIRTKQNTINRIIHWAGLKKDKLSQYERYDILKFYLGYFKKDLSWVTIFLFESTAKWLNFERKLKCRLKKLAEK